MNPIKKILPHKKQDKPANMAGKEPKDFLPVVLVIIIISSLLLIVASYLAKTQN
jgi:uncharacterized Tic20 family protein